MLAFVQHTYRQAKLCARVLARGGGGYMVRPISVKSLVTIDHRILKPELLVLHWEA